MKLVSAILGEFFGLFVEDEFLALALLALVAIAAVLSLWVGIPGAATGVILVSGAVMILLASVMRSARRS